MRTRFTAYLPLLLTLAFCSGCVVTCLNSPFDISRTEADKALLGVWRISDAEGGGSTNFRSIDNKEFQISITKDGQPTTEMFTAYSGNIGGRQYLWVTLSNSNEQKADDEHILVRYEIRENELQLWMLDPTKIKTAVAEGRLKGRGVGGTGEIELSGSAAELSKAIGVEEFWKKEQPLTRQRYADSQRLIHARDVFGEVVED